MQRDYAFSPPTPPAGACLLVRCAPALPALRQSVGCASNSRVTSLERRSAEALAETLGREFVDGYAAATRDPRSWGGGVEVDAFAQRYACRIHVLNVADRVEEVRGTGKGTGGG